MEHLRPAGQPAIDILDTRRVVHGTAKVGPGKVFKSDDTAILASEGSDPFFVLARENDPVPFQPGLFYDSFRDPLVNEEEDDVAWIGTVRGPAVTAKTRGCIFLSPLSPVFAPLLIARAGGPVVDVEGQLGTDLFYKSFSSLGLADGRGGGPVFVAKLSGPGVTAKNNTALFGGSLFAPGRRRLLRTGDRLGDRTIAKISALGALPGVGGATRSFNHRNGFTALLTFTDKTTALVRLRVP